MKMSITRTDPNAIEVPKKPPNKSASEHRKATKPIMEKRRRARINNSLEQLKTLILQAHNKDPSKYSKLEKADILEMTVSFLKGIQRKQKDDDSSALNHFRDGFDECAAEVKRFVEIVPDMDSGMKRRLKNHLSNGLTSLENLSSELLTSTNQTQRSVISFHNSSSSSAATLINTFRPVNSDIKSNNNSSSSVPESLTLATTITSASGHTTCLRPKSELELSTPPPSADSLSSSFRFSPISHNYSPLSHPSLTLRTIVIPPPSSPSSKTSSSITFDDEMMCTPVDCSKSASKHFNDPSVWRPW
ncbi:uncharacterized protein LOC141854812 [Brevipalpus obovatus]|uniref:uncharacterized protein LOC141854812 n=1 Tax=Brevipalpus obovatus TaxID=246614 RepID=UPI003D9DF83A